MYNQTSKETCHFGSNIQLYHVLPPVYKQLWLGFGMKATSVSETMYHYFQVGMAKEPRFHKATLQYC